MAQLLRLLRGSIFLCALCFAFPASPQVPPHYPGTICFTPYLWCYLPGAVPVGTQCYCRTQYGVVYGQAG